MSGGSGAHINIVNFYTAGLELYFSIMTGVHPASPRYILGLRCFGMTCDAAANAWPGLSPL